MGFNEAAGYGAVALTALATGYIADNAGLRPEPFYLGIAFAALGLGLSTLFVRETRGHADHEAADHVARHDDDDLSTGEVFRRTSFTDKALSSCSQAGMVNNLNDGLAWGLLPDLLRRRRPQRRPDRRARRPLPRGLGPRAARHRRPVGSDRPQAAHRRRHAHPGGRHRLDRRDHRLRAVGPRRGRARRRDRDGVPDAHRRDRRRRPPVAGGPGPSASTGSGATAASPSARSSPASSPTAVVDHRRDLGRRRPHRAVRARGARAHVRDPPRERRNLSEV